MVDYLLKVDCLPLEHNTIEQAVIQWVYPDFVKAFKNSNIEYRNTKWFDRLTILSTVEGQIRNSNVQMIETKIRPLENVQCLFFMFEILVIRICFEFRILKKVLAPANMAASPVITRQPIANTSP